MLPYIIVFLFSSICTFVAYKNQRVNLIFIPLIVLSVLIPAMLSGYRDLTVGIDVLMYGLPTFDNVYWIDGLRAFWEEKTSEKLEVGYVFFNWLVRRSTDNFGWFLFWQQLFALTFVQIACWRLRDRLNAPLLYTIYLVYYFCISMCHLRQMLAVALVMAAFSYAIEKQWRKYAIWLFIAMLFHRSAVIMFIIYPIARYTDIDEPIRNKYLFYILVGGTILVTFFPIVIHFLVGRGFISSHYAKYADAAGNNIHKADLLITFCIYFFHQLRSEGNNYFANNISVLSLMSLFILACGMYNDVAQRIAYYMNLYIFINVLCLTRREGRFALNRYELMLLAMLTVQFVYVGLRFHFANVIPYTSVRLGIM